MFQHLFFAKYWTTKNRGLNPAFCFMLFLNDRKTVVHIAQYVPLNKNIWVSFSKNLSIITWSFNRLKNQVQQQTMRTCSESSFCIFGSRRYSSTVQHSLEKELEQDEYINSWKNTLSAGGVCDKSASNQLPSVPLLPGDGSPGPHLEGDYCLQDAESHGPNTHFPNTKIWHTKYGCKTRWWPYLSWIMCHKTYIPLQNSNGMTDYVGYN